jgi:chemotaxis methyl-accepting protein methylase
MVADSFAADLQPASFELVYCRNGLRLSTKAYWRRSLLRFHELLSPGGALLLENVNASGVQNEVDELLAECEFVPLVSGAVRAVSRKYVIGMWSWG